MNKQSWRELKMKKRLGRALACLFAGIVAVSAADWSLLASAADQSLIYYICPSSKALKQDETDYSEMKYKGNLSFNAAANERESAQVIITGKGKYTDFKMKLVDDLENAETGITIPESCLQVYYEHYVQEVASWGITDSGVYPDALIPEALACDSSVKANSFTLNSTKKNQGLWFTLDVPAGQEAGTYTGKLHITYKLDGADKSDDISVSVKVYDFELADKTESASHLAVHATSQYLNSIVSLTGIAEKDGQTANHVFLDAMNAFLDERKISSGTFGEVVDGIKASNLQSYVDGLYEIVSQNQAPYYDITTNYRHSTQPIKLSENNAFFTELKNGLTAFKKYGITIPDIYTDNNGNNYKISTLESMMDLEWAVSSVKTRLQSHIRTIAGKLTTALQAQADSYLGNNKSVLAAENEKLNDVLQHVYAEYLISYCKKNEAPNQDAVRSMLSGDMKLCGRAGSYITLPYYYYLYTPMCVISQYDWDEWNTGDKTIGVAHILRSIVDKSMEKKTDMLQYAHLYIPQVDEPTEWLFSQNLETLVNAYILDRCKANVRSYINKKSATTVVSKRVKESLLKSLDNLMFLFTTTATGKGTKTVDYFLENKSNTTVYTAIQYKGLKFLKSMSNWSDMKKLLSSRFKYDSVGKKYYYKESFQKIFSTDTSTNPISCEISIPEDFFNKDYCPLFNDFSKNTLSYAKDRLTTMEALNSDGISMWWYSCVMSDINGVLSGFRLNQNRGKVSQSSTVYMNPLAVKRANKWQQFQMGIRGELYWAVDAWFNDTDHLGLKGNEDLLVYPIKLWLKNYKGINDEKALNSQAKKYGYFCSTIRLENEAEAADDYDYLCLAEQLVDQHPEYRERLNSFISTVIVPERVDYTNNKTNSSNLEKARQNLAELIEELTVNIQRNSDYFTIDPVSKWKTSNKAISFDFKPTSAINPASQVVGSLYLYQNSVCLTQYKRLRLDGSSTNVVGTITKMDNGWYHYTVPLGALPENVSGYGKKTANRIKFSSMNHRFLIKDFKILKEVAANGIYSAYNSTSDNVPVVSKWHTSGKTLCFDVFETDTERSTSGAHKATVALVNSSWKRLNKYIFIDFDNHKITGCPGTMIPKGNGWYTVQIPLNTVTLNTAEGATGTETLSMVYFRPGEGWLSTSLLADNFKILKEVTASGTNNAFNSANDQVPVVKKWYSSGKTLCFDVFETDTERSSNTPRKATVSLMNSGWDRLNNYIFIDFENQKITGCPGSMISKGNGWYTIEIPLSTVKLNTAEGATGTETLSMVYFRPGEGWLGTSLLVDNFRLK